MNGVANVSWADWRKNSKAGQRSPPFLRAFRRPRADHDNRSPRYFFYMDDRRNSEGVLPFRPTGVQGSACHSSLRKKFGGRKWRVWTTWKWSIPRRRGPSGRDPWPRHPVLPCQGNRRSSPRSRPPGSRAPGRRPPSASGGVRGRSGRRRRRKDSSRGTTAATPTWKGS